MAFDQQNYVSPTADGRFEVVIGGQVVATYADQGEAERRFNQETSGKAGAGQPTGFAGSQFQTPNGPRTLDQMREELRNVGWDGDPSNPAAVLDAYRRTTGGSGAGAKAGGPAGKSSTTGNTSVDAFLDQLAQGNRERYDEMVRQFNETTKLGKADRSGYLESGDPTLQREQSEFNRQAATGYVRYDPSLNRPRSERSPGTTSTPSAPGGASAREGERNPDGTYQTPNGPRTLDQMRSELRGANWPGDASDETDVVETYIRTAQTGVKL